MPPVQQQRREQWRAEHYNESSPGSEENPKQRDGATCLASVAAVIQERAVIGMVDSAANVMCLQFSNRKRHEVHVSFQLCLHMSGNRGDRLARVHPRVMSTAFKLVVQATAAARVTTCHAGESFFARVRLIPKVCCVPHATTQSSSTCHEHVMPVIA
ncbi:hypothetical protein AMTR_s00002p00173810 [Amborella trichopoda]|uniref:Uncharacterized protein n=1 Tax=Amborella trichopoda TaxID=13333 RepID=W1NZG8_AMBTC|nr:hypothetical protein AMTR_s00002p00173810 [Amborella trichopoda]